MKKILMILFVIFTAFLYAEELFFDDFESGLGNWNSIINSGSNEWIVYSEPYPNSYSMPPTSSGNVCSADSDEAGSGSSTDCTIELSTALNLTTYENIILEFDNDFNAIDADDYCYVDVSSDGGTTWTNVLQFAGVDVTATHEIVDISAIANLQSSVLIRFHSVQPGWDWWWTIDNVQVTGDLAITYDNDLAAFNIDGNTIINAGNTENYEITVKNIGNNAQDNYVVTLYKDNDIELNSIDINQTIAPDEVVIHNLVWNVPEDEPSGFVEIYGKVTLDGDENPANNETNSLDVQIFPPGTYEITVGEGTDNNTRTPVCFEYKNSLTEIIYFAEELAGGEGMITAITYYNNFTSNLINKPTAIWLGETTQTNLTDNWIPSTSLTEVFNGTVTYPSGNNTITIELTTPYFYNGGNLVVMSFRPMDTQFYATTDYFIHDTTPEHIDRTRYERDNNIVLDPANPPLPEDSYTGEFFANTTFTFYLGAMGEVEGYVYDDANLPLEGAQVTIEETQTVTYTNDQGYYHFGNILTGEYDFTAYTMGYSPQTFTEEVIEDEVTQLDFNLIPLGMVLVSGQVVGSDLPAIGLENAVVQITGFENYETTTDENGNFTINGVYTNITYDLQISSDGYDNYDSEIQVGSTALDLGTITLDEIAYPPGNVVATQNPLGTEVALSWSSPGQGGGEFRYDDGDQSFLFGLNSTPANAVFGAVHPNISVIEEIQWFLCSDYGSHSQVKLYIFGLDDDDKPNSTVVLYESGFLTNIDDEWNTHQINEPIEAYQGFFVGVSTPNEYTSIGLDDGIGEPWEFQTGTQFLKDDWTSGGQWTELSTYGANYERNFMIRAYGINMGNTLVNDQSSEFKRESTSRGSREFETYNIYRFYENQYNAPADWELIAQEIGDTTYVDESWVNLPNATYQFAVRSVYTNGVESIPAFSVTITKTSASSSNLPPLESKLYKNFPNPFNPSTTISFSLDEATTKVDIEIFNLKGQKIKSLTKDMNGTSGSVVWDGTDNNDQPVSSGVYFYRMQSGTKIMDTKKMLLLK